MQVNANCTQCMDYDFSSYERLAKMSKKDLQAKHPELIKIHAIAKKRADKLILVRCFQNTLRQKNNTLKKPLRRRVERSGSTSTLANRPTVTVFLSFSMPGSLMDDVVNQFKSLENVEFKIRGFKGTFQETIQKLVAFNLKYKTQIQIDPEGF